MHIADGCPLTRDEVRTYMLLFLRFFLASSFLFAAFDKLVGLGYPNPWMHGYVFGGDPVGDFLRFGTGRWFGSIFVPLADFSGVLNVVIIGAMLLLGTSMLLGIGTRLSAVLGSLMLFMLFLATVPGQDMFVFDYRIAYIVLLPLLCLLGVYDEYSLKERWEATPLVRRFPLLRRSRRAARLRTLY
jgi:thiosulfate dehydrogenase [quinone] large subunit